MVKKEKVDSFNKKAKCGPVILEEMTERNNDIVIITDKCR